MRLVLLAAALASALSAQDGTRHYGEVRVLPDGRVLDFHPEGAWRRQATRVRELWAQRLAETVLGAPSLVAQPAVAAVTGTKRVPAILFAFADSARGMTFDTSLYAGLLFGSPAPPDRPYSMRTYFDEISNGQVTILGGVVGWIQLSKNEVEYTGPYQGCSGNPYGTMQCNGIWSSTASSAMLAGLQEALAVADAQGVDWGLYDNDGPDGVPNSGDDDGFVDMTIFVHSEKDGACASSTNNHLWSHRWVVNFTTSTPAAGGGNIRIRDYTLQAGVGGPTACNEGQVMAIGTASHETGHAFGLPDLYATNPGMGAGIGVWGLMGSGNYQAPATPAYMSAWARAELGWVTTVVVTGDTLLDLSPVATSDTVLVLPVPGSSEYFLVENRQRLGSDVALRGTGLLIWHVDSTLIRQRRSSNTVNGFQPYGLALEQADGANHLQLSSGGNSGDAADPFPGFANRTGWSSSSTPSSARNNGTHTWITVDQIEQVAADGPVRLRYTFGPPVTVAIVGSGTVSASSGQVFPGTAPLKSSTTFTAEASPGFSFFGWSGDTTTTNAGLTLAPTRAWNVTATFAAPLTLSTGAIPAGVVGSPYQHTMTAAGGLEAHTWHLVAGQLPTGLSFANGVISGVPAEAGTFPITVQVRSGGVSVGEAVTLTVAAPILAVAAVVEALTQNTGALTSSERTYLDLIGNRNGRLDVGDFLAWVHATGATPTAVHLAAMRRAGGVQ